MTLKIQKEIDNFAEKVKDFCQWAESDFAAPLEELQEAEQHLAALHLAILQLPEAETIWDEVEDLKEFEKDQIARQINWKKCRERFENLPVNGYWEVFNAGNIEDKEAVYTTISDDLADIYSDLKFGLLLYEKEMFPEAFWQWRFNFQIHWGNHLVGAQKAIRNYFAYETEK